MLVETDLDERKNKRRMEKVGDSSCGTTERTVNSDSVDQKSRATISGRIRRNGENQGSPRRRQANPSWSLRNFDRDSISTADEGTLETLLICLASSRTNPGWNPTVVAASID
jgi:hypothetical protein